MNLHRNRVCFFYISHPVFLPMAINLLAIWSIHSVTKNILPTSHTVVIATYVRADSSSSLACPTNIMSTTDISCVVYQ